VELTEPWAILRRRWWLVLLVPVAAAALLLWQSSERPYQVTVRATVLIPGDTEVPGSSERPELMVLDDLPSLVGSRAFAEGVRVAMRATDLTVEDVQASLSGSRFSRVLTVSVTRDDPTEATEIAEAVSQTLPNLVNTYLVPQGGAPATVRIIDPPSDPTRSRPNQALKDGVVVLVALVFGAGLAVAADAIDPRLHDSPQIERALGAPVLADLRRRRRRRRISAARRGTTV
jgi:capsular polysaccharide biosynthesis protein